jgi:phosphoglycolate phosphatase
MTDRHLKGMFQVLVGTSDSRPHKPDPTGAFEAAKLLGVEPKDLFYFGDTETDMLTSINAGFVNVAVAWGFRSVETLGKYNPDVILEHPLDFLVFLDENYE